MKDRQAQLNKVFRAFAHGEPKTMKEVDKEIGVMRESICRYVAALRKTGRLFAVKERKCRITNHTAMTWTSDPNKVPPSPQLKLWSLRTDSGKDKGKISNQLKS